VVTPAAFLATMANKRLTVLVHGYDNERLDVLDSYATIAPCGLYEVLRRAGDTVAAATATLSAVGATLAVSASHRRAATVPLRCLLIGMGERQHG